LEGGSHDGVAVVGGKFVADFLCAHPSLVGHIVGVLLTKDGVGPLVVVGDGFGGTHKGGGCGIPCVVDIEGLFASGVVAVFG